MVLALCAAAVDAAIGAWLAEQATAQGSGEPQSAAAGESDRASALVAIAVDGKTVRGATDAEGNQVHLLAAATHDNTLVLGQVEVGAKSNEIPLFAPLLDGLADAGVDLTRAVITADALCRRHNASYEDVRVMPRCCPGTQLVAVSPGSEVGVVTGFRGRP